MSSAQLSLIGGTATGSASRATTRGQSLRPVAFRLFRDNHSRRRPGTGGTHEHGTVNALDRVTGWSPLAGGGPPRSGADFADVADSASYATRPVAATSSRSAQNIPAYGPLGARPRASPVGSWCINRPSFCLGRPSASRPLRPRAIVACLKVGDCLVASIRIRARVTSSRAGPVYSGWGGRQFRGFR
jgi:hypothetical protein